MSETKVQAMNSRLVVMEMMQRAEMQLERKASSSTTTELNVADAFQKLIALQDQLDESHSMQLEQAKNLSAHMDLMQQISQ